MDDIETQQKASYVLEAAARIVEGSIRCGMIQDQLTGMAADVTVAFLRQHAPFVREATKDGPAFQMAVR